MCVCFSNRFTVARKLLVSSCRPFDGVVFISDRVNTHSHRIFRRAVLGHQHVFITRTPEHVWCVYVRVSRNTSGFLSAFRARPCAKLVLPALRCTRSARVITTRGTVPPGTGGRKNKHDDNQLDGDMSPLRKKHEQKRSLAGKCNVTVGDGRVVVGGGESTTTTTGKRTPRDGR